jgi:hypothetical protein
MVTRIEKRRIMTRLISLWEKSGKTEREFCIKRGFPVSTFYWWKNKLRVELPSVPEQTKVSTPLSFIQIKPPQNSGTMEYKFPSGGSLLFPSTLGIKDIAELLKQLQDTHD